VYARLFLATRFKNNVCRPWQFNEGSFGTNNWIHAVPGEIFSRGPFHLLGICCFDRLNYS
jgi:hypothetical protein